MSNFLSDIYGRLTSEASHLVKIEKRATLNAIDIQSVRTTHRPQTTSPHKPPHVVPALTLAHGDAAPWPCLPRPPWC